jgi:hypothetical protein
METTCTTLTSHLFRNPFWLNSHSPWIKLIWIHRRKFRRSPTLTSTQFAKNQQTKKLPFVGMTPCVQSLNKESKKQHKSYQLLQHILLVYSPGLEPALDTRWIKKHSRSILGKCMTLEKINMHKFHETRPYLAATSWSEESWKLISSISNHCHTLSFLHDKIPASEILSISRTTQSTSRGTLQR